MNRHYVAMISYSQSPEKRTGYSSYIYAVLRIYTAMIKLTTIAVINYKQGLVMTDYWFILMGITRLRDLWF